MLPLFGDRQPIRVRAVEVSMQLFGYFSPNGRWLAYAFGRVWGKNWRYMFGLFQPPAGVWPVSTGGGSQPRWRRDGKELFYLAPDGKLMAVERDDRGERFQAGLPKALFQMRLRMDVDCSPAYAVTSDGQRFLFADPAGRSCFTYHQGRAELASRAEESTVAITRSAYLRCLQVCGFKADGQTEAKIQGHDVYL